MNKPSSKWARRYLRKHRATAQDHSRKQARHAELRQLLADRIARQSQPLGSHDPSAKRRGSGK